MKKKKSKNGYYFAITVAIIYIIVLIINPRKTGNAFLYSLGIFKKIIPVLIIILIFMWLLKFIPRKKVKKYIGSGSGLKGWLIVALAGMLSHGPIYVWYPLLKELREKGMNNGMAATFLYCRAVKIPLLPMMIAYFGGSFTLILTLAMVVASLLEGIIIQRVLS